MLHALNISFRMALIHFVWQKNNKETAKEFRVVKWTTLKEFFLWLEIRTSRRRRRNKRKTSHSHTKKKVKKKIIRWGKKIHLKINQHLIRIMNPKSVFEAWAPPMNSFIPRELNCNFYNLTSLLSPHSVLEFLRKLFFPFLQNDNLDNWIKINSLMNHKEVQTIKKKKEIKIYLNVW